MKKLSKKQKIIGFIAVLLVAIIVGIVITTNIIKNNNRVASEEYTATTANAGSSLISNYILNGITIGGITGKMDVLDTSDATAEASDIAKGKTAYVNGKKIIGTRVELISDDELGITETNVYYADIEGDGIVEGVIFADLAGKEENGQWYNRSWASYSIPEGSGFKQYYIEDEYTDEHFGTGKVIAPIDGTDGNDRFYVMALKDFDLSTHYYYYYLDSNKNDEVYGISNTENDFAVAGAKPTGRVNTKRMIDAWNAGNGEGGYGEQNENDIWGLIQEEVSNGWFVPSKSEWAAFGAKFISTQRNCEKWGFKDDAYYWSSSQYLDQFFYNISINACNVLYNTGNYVGYVRLATTF